MAEKASPLAAQGGAGRHFLATYIECDAAALSDRAALGAALTNAAQAAGAKVLGRSEHAFDPEGYSAVLLLAESHASIHTYPETGCCFVDFFTCGADCDAEAFDAAMQQALAPRQTVRRTIARGAIALEVNDAPADEPALDGREWRVGA